MRSCDRYPVLAVVAAVALLLSMAAVANPAAATTAQSESASSPVTADHDHRSVAKKPRAKMSRYKPAGCATLTAAQRSSPVPHARCYALEYTTKAGKMLSRKAGPPSTATTPEEFQDAYNLPDGGAGVT
ncbi:MAG: hypothetical protein ACRDP4_15005, partial [Nocardioidaceae bacterium]